MSLVMVQTARGPVEREVIWVRWRIDSRGWLSAAHLVIGEVNPDDLRRGHVLLACGKRAPTAAIIVPVGARGRTCQVCAVRRGL